MLHFSNPTLWNTSEVLRWLKLSELDDFKDAFYANGFDGPKLLALNAMSFKVLLICYS